MMAAVAAVAHVCPGCAYRELAAGASFCDVCETERRAERYWQAEAESVHARRLAWRTRAERAGASYAAERQRRHRRLERVRPQKPLEGMGGSPRSPHARLPCARAFARSCAAMR